MNRTWRVKAQTPTLLASHYVRIVVTALIFIGHHAFNCDTHQKASCQMSDKSHSTKLNDGGSTADPLNKDESLATAPGSKMVPRGPQKEISRINFKQVLISSYESKMSARMLGWNLSPLWDAELAAHLIAVGGPVDIPSELELNASNPPAPSMAVAYKLCLKGINLCKAADPNFPLVASPYDWLKWAQENGYDIQHLIQLLPKNQVPRQFPDNAVIVNGHDHDDLATPTALIRAFGFCTGMDKSWFQKLEGPLLAARKKEGTSGRRSTPPMFCPYEVMIWLTSSTYKKGKKISINTGWQQLKKHFPRVYEQFEPLGPELE